MLQQKHLHPDAPLPGVTTTPVPKTTTPTIPAADADLHDVATMVANNWQATPAITLLWKKSSDFAADVSAYGSSLTGKLSSGSLRTGQTFTLNQLDKQITDAVKEVKVYIERKFKTTGATAQFARYGIVKENGSFRMSRDRNSRKEALKLMIAAIAPDGFAAEEFGTSFWTDM